MINKKTHLGKPPVELGVKDANHVAIVSVRAASLIRQGQDVTLNEHREAIPAKRGEGIGKADPFLTGNIIRGQMFWLVLKPNVVESVRHEWDHEQDFSPPTRPVEVNKYLQQYAEKLGVTYDQLLSACSASVYEGKETKYPGSLSMEQVEEFEETDDLWHEWSNETGYEFEDFGTICCPEYNYPELPFLT